MDIAPPLLIALAVVVLTMLGVVVLLLVRLVRTYPLIRDERMPTSGKLAFWLAALYTVSPIDVLPDPILLDDIALLLAAIAHVRRQARALGLGEAPTDSDQSTTARER